MSGGAAARLSAGQGTLTTAAPPAASSATASDLPRTAVRDCRLLLRDILFICGGSSQFPGKQLMAAATVTGRVRETNRSQACTKLLWSSVKQLHGAGDARQALRGEACGPPAGLARGAAVLQQRHQCRAPRGAAGPGTPWGAPEGAAAGRLHGAGAQLQAQAPARRRGWVAMDRRPGGWPRK